jgi:hypothetical protein
LLKVIVPLRCPPTAVPPSEMAGELAASFAAGAWPVPETENDTLPASLVAAVICAATGPVWLGENVTGTEIVSWGWRVAGSDCDGVPSWNWLGSDEVRLEIVTVWLAVSVSVCGLLLEPTVVLGNDRADPLSGWVTGEPKPRTWPSRVPTYSRPAPTPATL